MAYYRAACSFFAWVERHRIGELSDIEPIHVAAYVTLGLDDIRYRIYQFITIAFAAPFGGRHGANGSGHCKSANT
jgi:hypothetical protein